MNVNRLFFMILFGAASVPAISQMNTKLKGTDLVGVWKLADITERCAKNDSVSHLPIEPTVLKFRPNGDLECSNEKDLLMGGMIRWSIDGAGTSLAVRKQGLEGNTFMPEISQSGDLLFAYQATSEGCGLVYITRIYHMTEKLEPPKPVVPKPEPVFVPNPDDPIFTEKEVDTVAVFGRGESSVLRYNAFNINYPQVAKDNYIQGRVMVEFIVEKNGSLSNFKILKDIGGGCGDEALRILKVMPRWIPAKKKGEYVRSRVLYPVIFKLE